MDAFIPSPASTVSIDVGATTANAKLSDGPVSVRVCNDGTATAWIEFGDDSVEADAGTSIPVPAGSREILRAHNNGSGPVYVAAIAADATGLIYFTPGRGGI